MVFEATDTSTGDRVAIKCFDPTQYPDTYRWESFQREANLLTLLCGQPDIVRAVTPLTRFDLVLTDPLGIAFPLPVSFYALELAKGNVAEEIDSGHWGPDRVLRSFRVMCRVVRRLHDQQIAHRDLKPHNFLLMPSGEVKLADFGTARRLSGVDPPLLSRYQYPAGDTWYSAPELFAGLHDADPTIAYYADVYALGAILFELFTRTPLAPLVFTSQFGTDLQDWMNATPPDARLRSYPAFIRSAVATYRLPSVAVAGSKVPRSIRPLLDALYQSLAALDYRDRPRDFDKIYQRVNSCLKVIEHAGAYQRLRELRRQRSEAASNIHVIAIQGSKEPSP